MPEFYGDPEAIEEPEGSEAALRPAREAGLLPAFPFGSDFTPAEQQLIPALLILQQAEQEPLRLAAQASEFDARSRCRGRATPRLTQSEETVGTCLSRTGDGGVGKKQG